MKFRKTFEYIYENRNKWTNSICINC
jgi:hypothetical protein